MNCHGEGESNYTRDMSRPVFLAAVLGVGLLMAADVAVAQPKDSSYAATFEEVVNNCPKNGYRLDKGTVRIATRTGRKITVTVAGIPNMNGSWGRSGGKFKAEARGATTSAGVDGKFSMAGRVDSDGIQALFIVELYRGDKPLCTQSWSVTGKQK